MRTKEEIEKILPTDSAQRKQALKSLEHSFSMYDYSGNHKPHPYETENLLDVISQRDMYVVDTNSEWKKECKLHPDKAFVISPALSREHPNTKDLILDATRCKLGNIFTVGLYANEGRVLIDRIDESFGYVFDMPNLREASREKGEAFVKQKEDNWIHIENDKTLIRNHIGLELLFTASLGSTPISVEFIHSGKASDLPLADKIQNAIDRLKANIKRRLPACKHNIGKSKIAVELCYATLVLEDIEPNGTRWQFDKPKYEHVFGDMYIVLTAIYLGAKIMTKDRKLAQMASYAGIKCVHVPSLHDPRC